jgi:3',5'-cyclic AMP phosphodiesterase CpdA
MPARILHISDLHFGPPFVPVVAEALLQSIPSLAPDAVDVSGDLAS